MMSMDQDKQSQTSSCFVGPNVVPYLQRGLQSLGGRCRRAAQPITATLGAWTLPRAAGSWLRTGRDADDMGVLPDPDNIFPDL